MERGSGGDVRFFGRRLTCSGICRQLKAGEDASATQTRRFKLQPPPAEGGVQWAAFDMDGASGLRSRGLTGCQTSLGKMGKRDSDACVHRKTGFFRFQWAAFDMDGASGLRSRGLTGCQTSLGKMGKRDSDACVHRKTGFFRFRSDEDVEIQESECGGAGVDSGVLLAVDASDKGGISRSHEDCKRCRSEE